MEYIERKISSKILECSKYYQVLVITGPRQTGKTTLCRHLFGEYSYYNLEDVALRKSIASDPKGFLDSCGRSVVIDEAQHIPELFSYIQLTVDNDSERHFVLTGSNNFALMATLHNRLPAERVCSRLCRCRSAKLPLSPKICRPTKSCCAVSFREQC